MDSLAAYLWLYSFLYVLLIYKLNNEFVGLFVCSFVLQLRHNGPTDQFDFCRDIKCKQRLLSIPEKSIIHTRFVKHDDLVCLVNRMNQL